MIIFYFLSFFNIFYKRVIQTFKKDPSYRSFEENELLIKILKQIPYFKNLYKTSDQSTLTKFIQKIVNFFKFETFNPEKIIIHHGDLGDKFYFILSGKVNIYVLKTNGEINESIKNHNSMGKLQDPDEELLLKNNNRKFNYLKKGVVKFKKLKELGPGKHFGEIALYLNKPRTATVVSTMQVDTITLKKDEVKKNENVFTKSIEFNIFLEKINKIFSLSYL